jgi:ComF family protein
MRFLSPILDLLFPPRDTEALVREASLSSLGSHAHARTHADGTVSLFPYKARLAQACVLEAKFQGNERAQQLLGSALAEYLQELDAEGAVLVPVPLSRERRAERGYDQCERIARYAAELAQVPLDTELLVRVRDTLPQTSLGRRERLRNLHGAFAVSRPPSPAHTYIVFDDVRTTGSTLAAAVSALKEAGAERVTGLSLAH